MKELWEEVTRLQSIREDEKEMDQIFSETLKFQGPKPSFEVEGLEESVPKKLESGNSHDGEGWKLVTSYTRRQVPAPSDNLQFQNRFTALAVD